MDLTITCLKGLLLSDLLHKNDWHLLLKRCRKCKK